MIADTSRAAYDSLKASGKLTFGQRQVMVWMHKQRPGQAFTRAEIAQGSKLPLQSVCGRVNELLEARYLEQLPTVKCPVTGNGAHSVRIPQMNAAAPAETPSPKPDTQAVERAAAAPHEQLINSYTAKGKPISYTASGVGPGHPPDQDVMRGKSRRAA